MSPIASLWATADTLYTPAQETGGLPLSFRWRLNPHHENFVVSTVDLIVERNDTSSATQRLPEFVWLQGVYESLVPHSTSIRDFVDNAIRAPQALLNPIGIKLILPTQDGYTARSDFIELRMHGCPFVASARDFLQPCQYVEQFPTMKPRSEHSQLYDILSACIGAVLVDTAGLEFVDHALDALEDQVQYRLAPQFLIKSKIPRKRVALVHCPHEILTYEAIRCLGVDLIVLDRPGHFLEDPKGPYAYLREAFYPLDLNVDDRLPQRIVDIVQDLKLDGIITRYDFYSTHVAEAAKILGLPSSPAAAFAIATDKYATRMLEAEHSGVIRVTDSDELERPLRDPWKPLEVQYPVVVKPCMGWSSLGVTKARNDGELLAAVRKAHSRVLGNQGDDPIQPSVVIEPYVDGPEVDVNLALWDGEIVFADISDDFPCHGDMDEQTHQTDFHDTVYVYLSILPQREQNLLYQSLRDSVLRMGFRTGVFHCEARVRNSAVKYVERDGVTDLEGNSSSKGLKPSVFMIEANPRPSGYFSLYGSTWTHGVDYYVLHVLRAILDEERFRVLAVPFSKEVQHSMAVLNFLPETSGILRSSDPAIRLRKLKPWLMDRISLHRSLFEPGRYVPPVDAVDSSLLGSVLVESKLGREDLLRSLEDVRQEWIYDIDNGAVGRHWT
ncbi:hypothetical protein BDV11DRAFT_97050 [Aspergillus similis]